MAAPSRQGARVKRIQFLLLVTLLGGVVAMLSVTGVLIWARKRRARVAGRRRITRAI